MARISHHGPGRQQSRAVVWCALFALSAALLPGCSDSSNPAKDSGMAGADASSEADGGVCSQTGGASKPASTSGEECGSSPRVLVDAVGAIPECADGHTAPLIAVNATHIYFILQWTLPDTVLETWRGYLMQVPLQGGKEQRLALLPNGSVHMTQGLALTSSKVVFIQAGKEDDGNATIATVPLAGGEVMTLSEASGSATAVVVDDRNAYFADTEGVKIVALTGGASRTLAAGIAPLALALSGGTLYFTTSSSVGSIPIEGGKITDVATTGGLALAAAGTRMCWMGGSALMATLMSFEPGTEPMTLASGIMQPHDLVFDGEAFYVSGGRGVISRVPAQGGASVPAFVEPGVTDLAVEGGCLYWSSPTTISAVSLEAARKAKLME